jgi:peptidoglycan hydrolase CwlO-like protein
MNVKMAVILGLALLLLPCGRLFAWDNSARTEEISAKAEQASESVRNMQSKIDDLQSKINRLEDKISSRDSRLEALERKAREEAALERRVRPLEGAREERKE